jgi:hypothetical protein
LAKVKGPGNCTAGAKANTSKRDHGRRMQSTEVKTMRNSINGNWWAASLLGEPVDGSSN